ncbi:10404_t:CDS:10 [Acaulospora morrowiae]|uniref:Glutathione hydrolase n=1 Tax=Acaulospora morrowiae TaxID=94023 RepID=A0A9N9AV88_9GLOM|nr:10404_t:CDS:10 [Acaulospora morrowiae]
MVIETIEDSQEVVNRSVNLIWRATHGKIVSIIFNQIQTVTLTFDNGKVKTVGIDVPDAVLIRENVFSQLSRELAVSNKDNPINVDDSSTSTVEDELAGDIQGEAILLTSVNQSNQSQNRGASPSTGVNRSNQSQNREASLSTGANQDNQFRDGEASLSTGANQNNQPQNEEASLSTGAVQGNRSWDGEASSSTGANQSNQSKHKRVTQSSEVNKFSKVSKEKRNRKRMRFHINKQKLKIRQDKDMDNTNWSECEECHGERKELCKLCGCFICERKIDGGRILLCDGDCGNGYHTYCLNPPIDKIPSGKWYCDRCKSQRGKKVVLINDDNRNEVQIPLERDDSLGINQSMSDVMITTCGPSMDIDFLGSNNDDRQLDEIRRDDPASRSHMLKKIFTDVTTDQLDIRGDQLLSRNDSMESFFTLDFNYLFDIGDIHFSLKSLPSYSTSNWKAEENMLKMIYDLRKPFLALLVVLSTDYERKNNGLSPVPKVLRGLVAEKMMTALCIDDRQERRYWSGMWRLIELLHVTRCPVAILIMARINSTFLLMTSINNYNKFLIALLGDEEAHHKNPVFDKLLMQKGSIAKSLVKAIKASGGLMTLEDLADYRPVLREPVVGYYHGRKVITTPEPASGAILIFMLNILEGYELNKSSLTGINLHRLVETLKFGFARRTELGDAAFFENKTAHELRILDIISKKYASIVRNNISDDRTHETEYYNPVYAEKNDHGTTHLSTIDKDDMAVAFTSTVVDPNTGIIFNNQLDDFSIPGGPDIFGMYPSPYNFIAPGKKPLSSTVPTIIEKDGKLEMTLGGSGGTRILTAVLEVILDVFDFDMNVLQAIKKSRIHQQLKPEIAFVESGFPFEILKDLVNTQI